jgi:8-oxo-dGTP pyrophosphatase MutT (NUDIX family)
MAERPRRVLSAGLVVRSTAGRVLLAELSYTQRWDVVGGVVESGESVVEATDVLDLCGPRIGPRLTAALDALRTGRLPGPPLMLVDGVPER